MSDPQLQQEQKIDDLRRRLAALPLVNGYGHEEAGTLVHALFDLEESFRVFVREQFPKLIDPAMQGEQLEDLLLEVREEFRHILYHIHDPELFRVVEPTHEWLVLAEAAKK